MVETEELQTPWGKVIVKSLEISQGPYEVFGGPPVFKEIQISGYLLPEIREPKIAKLTTEEELLLTTEEKWN